MPVLRVFLFAAASFVLACSGSDTQQTESPSGETAQAEPPPAETREPTTEEEAPSPEGEGDGFDVRPWQTLLTAYATDDGGVRYEALRANEEHLALLEALVSAVASADASEWSRDARLAFFINAYNVITMGSVLAHWPLGSVMESEGFFDGETHRVAGVERTLNQLEADVIRSDEFGEPRIHFAVNCASAGCPPLSRTSYTAANLEEQLARQTDAFIRGTSLIERDESRVRVSQLLEWYADDFGGADGVRAFLVAHLEGDDAAFVRSASTRVEHFDYDWTLNRR